MATVSQIKSIPLTRLTLSLHAAFHQSIKELIDKYTAVVLHLEPQYSLYSQCVAEELLISNRQTTYVVTSQVETGSKAQLNSVGVVLNCVKAHQTSTIPAKSDAGIKLAAVLAPFFGMSKRKYAEATLDTQAMIALLRTPEPAAWIAILKLEDEVDEAEVRNNFMREVIAKKSAENAARTPQSDVESNNARRFSDTYFYDIVKVANAYAIVSPSDENAQFITDVNGVIETYKSYIDAGSSNTPTVNPTPDVPETDDNDVTPTPTPDPDEDPTPEPEPNPGENEDDEEVVG